MKIITVVEAERDALRKASLSAVTLAREAAALLPGAEVELLLLGDGLEAAAAEASRYAPTTRVLQHPSLEPATADRHAAALAEVVRQRGAGLVVAASTSRAKDCVARAAGLLGGAMVSDASACALRDGRLAWRRSMHAGSVAAWVALRGEPAVVTALPSAFPPAEPGEAGEICAADVDVGSLPAAIRCESVAVGESGRPDPTEAAIVVSGGRAFRSAEDYERLVGGLADALGAATGSTRAAVDAGIAPNENQVGQTGKIVAPDLYLGIGVSGAIQHLTGMIHSKVIVAINTDEDAPLLAYSDYALIADAYEAVPEMIEKL